MEKVCQWCGQPSDRGWLKNRTVVLRCICVADISLLLITVLSQDVPEFELHFDKVYKWVASSIAEKNAFILSLWKAS